VARIVGHVDALPGSPEGWPAHPGGIEAALVDAIFSANARYRTTPVGV